MLDDEGSLVVLFSLVGVVIVQFFLVVILYNGENKFFNIVVGVVFFNVVEFEEIGLVQLWLVLNMSVLI